MRPSHPFSSSCAEGADLAAARDRLRAAFPVAHSIRYRIETWKDMQGPLLAAVQWETTILNILLFLIIGVAGFGIFATFFMIVVEKTKDIGILKSLGSIPVAGVMSIFLSYGLLAGHCRIGRRWRAGRAVCDLHQSNCRLDRVFHGTAKFLIRRCTTSTKSPRFSVPFTIAMDCGWRDVDCFAGQRDAGDLRAARMHPVEALAL